MPLFITFEGGEGAGKTTLIQKIYDMLVAEGYSVLVTREPGGSKLGDRIRDLLLHREAGFQVSAKAELFLFLAARIEHLEELILPALKEDKIVLCDRFNDSTIAYQGLGRGLGVENVEALCNYAVDGLQPNLTFYLDIDPALGLKRVRGAKKEKVKAGELDRIEALKHSFHMKVRKAFLEIAEKSPERVKVIDAHLSPEAVFKRAVEQLLQLQKV